MHEKILPSGVLKKKKNSFQNAKVKNLSNLYGRKYKKHGNKFNKYVFFYDRVNFF